jgi:hypothetical protein
MTGTPPSQRGGRPADIAAHASQVAQEWADVSEGYVRRRMKELGVPDHQIGQPDYGVTAGGEPLILTSDRGARTRRAPSSIPAC